MNRLLTWFPTLAPLYRRFEAASVRERVLVSVCTYLVVAVVLFFLVLEPSMGYRAEQLRAQASAENGLQWMVDNQAQAKQRSGQQAPQRHESKLTTISSSADMHNVTIKRMQPGDDRINVELASQSYLAVVGWLTALEADHGFRLADVRLEKVAEGIVDSRLTLR